MRSIAQGPFYSTAKQGPTQSPTSRPARALPWAPAAQVRTAWGTGADAGLGGLSRSPLGAAAARRRGHTPLLPQAACLLTLTHSSPPFT